MKHLLVVDDHAMVRRGLVSILGSEVDGHQISCDEAGDGREALTLIENNRYDLVILDISMPGMGGLELLSHLNDSRIFLPVLMLSMFPEEQFALRAFRLGAAGYLTKKEAADELLQAVGQIFSGRRYISPHLSCSLIDQAIEGSASTPPNHTSLSNREFQILRALATGKSLKVIALELEMSIKTVSTYKTRLFTKMGFRSDADLICYVNSNNLN